MVCYLVLLTIVSFFFLHLCQSYMMHLLVSKIK